MISGSGKKDKQINKLIKDFLEFSENEGTTYSNLWDNESSVKRKVHSMKFFHKEIRNFLYQQFKSILESSRKEKKKRQQAHKEE